MTVGEIREKLDEYGDHVDCALELENGTLRKIIAVDDRTAYGGVFVTFTAEGM